MYGFSRCVFVARIPSGADVGGRVSVFPGVTSRGRWIFAGGAGGVSWEGVPQGMVIRGKAFPQTRKSRNLFSLKSEWMKNLFR